MNTNFTNYLLKITQATSCKEVETIQSLWSGYGRISRFELGNTSLKTVVVKFINLDSATKHPRGWNTNYSHNRKVKSYEVETNWYQQWSKLCSYACRVPELIGTFSEGNKQWIVMEDLNNNFPVRKTQVTLDELKVCLQWLANFHATFLNQKPTDLWEIGTYWHLKTRPEEFNKIEHQELKGKATVIDSVLNQCTYKTIVHGDAKLANFCFSEDGEKVAAVDFQYVGGGCGIKDVAYLLGSCLLNDELEHYETELLDYYFVVLKKALFISKPKVDVNDLEKEWRQLYPIACVDFMRFLLGWMPTHQKINEYNLNIMNSVLESL